MNCDCAFRIGKGHEVCQDYAYATIDPFPYIIISDGCSSSVDTDYGARVLTSAARHVLKINHALDNPNFFPTIAAIAESHRQDLFLPREAFDCTLMVAAVRPVNPKMVEITVMGDGVVVIKNKMGEVCVYSIEYTTGYPSYLSYLLDDDRLQSWEKRMCYDTGDALDSIVVRTYVRSINNQWNDDIFAHFGNTLTLKVKEVASYISRLSHQFHTTTCPWTIDQLEYVVLMSDGIRSFSKVTQEETGTHKESLSLTKVLDNLLDFKGFNGVFAHRRLNKFLKDMEKENCEHFDDISLAVMSFVE